MTDANIPIFYAGSEVEGTFDTYLHTNSATAARQTEERAWRLFQLTDLALRARLVHDSDELMSLEHLDSFTPLAHQMDTARRVVQELHGRAILADEVGLGKTIEAGLVMKEYQVRGLARKMLVLVPATLVMQWVRELNGKFRLDASAQRSEWSWSQDDVVVASLDTAKREPHRQIVLSIAWDIVVIDEAHKLKNQKTKNWQMVNQIPNKFLLLLTATPIQNDLRELHTLTSLLRPGHLGSRSVFQETYVDSSRVARNPDQLRVRLGDIMIRNRRRDGGVVLPARHVTAVRLSLSRQEQELYDATHVFLRAQYDLRKQHHGSLLPLITLQREICSSPYAAMLTLERMKKRSTSASVTSVIDHLLRLGEQIPVYTKVEVVLEMLKHLQEKCIVFTEYRATQDFLLYRCRQQGISALPFRGGFGRGKKDWMKDLFQQKMQVLVATESGGEGINLQFCHHMINYDLPWNPMRLEQRIGRIHRLGQTKEVEVRNLATEGTIEAHIVDLLQEKIRLFETVIGEVDTIFDAQKTTAFEQKIFEMAMESDTDYTLKSRLQTLSSQVEWGVRS